MGFLANFVLPAEIAAKRVKNLSPRRRRRRADAKLTQTLLTVSQAVFIKTRPARQKKRRKNVIKKKEERDRLFSCSAHVIGFVASVDNENDNRRLLFCSVCFFFTFFDRFTTNRFHLFAREQELEWNTFGFVSLPTLFLNRV